MKHRTPKRIVVLGGILIIVSGVANSILGLKIGATFYEAYPGGNMGHVGIIAGLIAILIGLLIVFIIVPLVERPGRITQFMVGLLTIVIGHLGGVAGAIYVGTAGVALCYVGGIWLIVLSLRKPRIRDTAD